MDAFKYCVISGRLKHSPVTHFDHLTWWALKIKEHQFIISSQANSNNLKLFKWSTLQPGHEFLGTPYSPYAAVKVGLMKQQNKHTTNNHTTNNHTTYNHTSNNHTTNKWADSATNKQTLTPEVPTHNHSGPSVQALNIVHLKHLGRYWYSIQSTRYSLNSTFDKCW